MKKLLVITNKTNNRQDFFALSGENAFEEALLIVFCFADKRHSRLYQDELMFTGEGTCNFKANGYNLENVKTVCEYEARFEKFVSVNTDDWDEAHLKLDTIR